MILGDILARNAALFGSAPALLFEERVITHRQLSERANALANALFGLGVRKQERIVVLAQNRPEFFEIYGAAGIAGFIGCGLNYRLSAAEQLQIVADCAPAVWIFEAQYAQRVAQVCAGLDRQPLLICLDAPPLDAQPGVLDYASLLAGASVAAPPIRATESDTVLLIYTSGTTGKPKGVMLGQAGEIEQARVTSAASHAQPVDRLLLVMPLYHVGAIIKYLTYAWVGAPVILHRMFDPLAVYDSFSRHRITAALLAPVMLKALLDLPAPADLDTYVLHTIFYSSAPMPVPLLRRAMQRFGPVFAQVYGMTENPLGTYLYKHQHILDGAPLDVERLASAGQVYFGCEIEIRDPHGRLCGPGEPGEITIRSPAMMQGYWNNTIATREALRDNWYYSGDMGYLDDEGFLFVVDRKKDMIISGGENIYSREVEEALMSHPQVIEAAVIGVPDETWGESVLAFVVAANGVVLNGAELIEHCRERIASYKKPRSVLQLDALPRTVSTNKVDKKQLREPYWGVARKL
jgi:acyl-CoA synthetase (AMP-forming)/AMP-acid ligase II